MPRVRLGKLFIERRGTWVVGCDLEKMTPRATSTKIDVFDGASGRRVGSLDGPALGNLRLGVDGDTLVLGDFTTGILAGFAPTGTTRWTSRVDAESLHAIRPNPHGPGLALQLAGKLLAFDAARAELGADSQAIFEALPRQLGTLWIGAGTSGQVLLISGWELHPDGGLQPRTRLDEMLGKPAEPRRRRVLSAFTFAGGHPSHLWTTETSCDELAAHDEGLVAAVVREGDAARALWIEPTSGQVTSEIVLPAVAAISADATRAVAATGALFDLRTGARVHQLTQ